MIQYEILNGIIFQLLLFSISISLSPYNMRSLFIDACTIITSKDLPKVAIKSFWTYTKNIEVILSITKSICFSQLAQMIFSVKLAPFSKFFFLYISSISSLSPCNMRFLCNHLQTPCTIILYKDLRIVTTTFSRRNVR